MSMHYCTPGCSCQESGGRERMAEAWERFWPTPGWVTWTFVSTTSLTSDATPRTDDSWIDGLCSHIARQAGKGRAG